MSPPRLLPVALLATLLGIAGAALGWRGDPSQAPAPDPASRVGALQVLRSWDAARATAWASGDRIALAALYTPGAAAGRADLTLQAAYADRGLRVRGLVPQLLDVEVLGERPGLLRLRVTDRLGPATAVGRGRARILPRDQPSTRVITLERVDGRWRVAAVQPAR